MATIDQTITPNYCLYNADCIEIAKEMPSESIHLSIYSPPFATKNGQGLYNYSSSERDFSNATSYEDFFDHYKILAKEIERMTKPGCFTAIHCMDVPFSVCNLGNYVTDFPGHIIAMHEALGFKYVARHTIWKEPLGVRLRTMAKGLAHKTIVDSADLCDVAGGDYLIIMRKDGARERPVSKPTGLHEYYGETEIPDDLKQFRGYKGRQTENRFSHWIWRRYASCIWDDVRMGYVVPYEEGKDQQDEKHVHPLQLDVIARCVELRTNPDDVVFTPFMGVGSEVYQSVRMGRKAFGAELKPSYYRQAVKNCAHALSEHKAQEGLLITDC